MRKIDARTISKYERHTILIRDEYQCGYCGAEAECVDHIVPWSYKHDNNPENLITVCWLCNGIAGNRMFDTITEKKDFILKKVEKLLKRRRIAVWVESDLQELGYILQNQIRADSVVVNNENEKIRAQIHIEKLGLLTC